ncbi:MAG: YcgN family cysteine cluster protein [Alphaproteobacteria bacterium]|nr:YcgN family cysteine cluster protein [Alphaproteobacteria bacterium]
MAFWEDKRLDQMTDAEWEALCDGCGRCCLIKLEDEDTGEIWTSDVRCRLLDGTSCRCTDYPDRKSKVPDCIKLDLDNLKSIGWIPTTCAYRRLAEGKGLAWWHPLVSGDPQTVIAAGISVSGRTLAEKDVPEDEWENHIASWPEWDPEE